MINSSLQKSIRKAKIEQQVALTLAAWSKVLDATTFANLDELSFFHLSKKSRSLVKNKFQFPDPEIRK